MRINADIYSKNLAALKAKDPFLYTEVESCPDSDRLEVLESKSGVPVVKVLADDRQVTLHSVYDPVRDAEKLVNAAIKEEAAIYVVQGFGFGYHVVELERRVCEESKILVVERNMDVFVSALRHIDMTELINSPKVCFSVNEKISLTQLKFKRLINYWQEPSIETIRFAPAVNLDPGFFAELTERIRDEFLVDIRNIGTLIFLSTLWQYNTLKNLEYIIKSPGVNRIAEDRLFEGRTVVMVSAGPSLNKSIGYLKEYKDRVTIICVGTALKALLKHGIKPDIVVAVDGSHKMMAQFEGLELDGIHLVSSSSLFPGIVELFKGQTFFFGGGNEVVQWLSPVIGENGSLAVGGTVAVSAIDLAVQGGAENILLIGQDLSYLEDGTTHADNTMYDGVKADTSGWRRIPGNYDEEVLTDSMFFTYLKIMERLVAGIKTSNVVNCTAGGARIEGLEPMDFKQALETYCTGKDKKDPIKDVLEGIASRHVVANLDILLMNMEDACEGLENLRQMCSEAISCCNQLIFLSKQYYDDSEEKINANLDRLKHIDAEMIRMEEFNKLIAMTIRGACFGVSTKPKADEKKLTKAIFANKRSREFYEQITGACMWTREILEPLKNKMEKELEDDIAAGL